ncbi:TolC family protein [Massilia sp. SR12]
MRTIRLPGIAAGAALLFPLLATADPITSTAALRQAVEQAWQRSPLARALEARQEEAAAASALANSWLAAAPTLGLSERSDRWTDQRGQRETEVSLAAQVLLPGQHTARQRHAARSSEELALLRDRARLAVAGEVRQRLWEAAAAREVLAEKTDHRHHLEELRDDVARRVKAGDLARSDALLAEQEVLAAANEVTLARGRAAETMTRLAILTGLSELPELDPEPLADAPAAPHLRLRVTQASEERAKAAVQLASAGTQSSPTVALSMRRERGAYLAESDRSIGVALQIPIVGATRNRPAAALAATQLATASAERQEAESAVAAELSLARLQLENVRAGLQAAVRRAEAMREHTALFEKAFAQGERSLAELLRSRALTHEAEVALRQQRVAIGLAHAQLNQALGTLP